MKKYKHTIENTEEQEKDMIEVRKILKANTIQETYRRSIQITKELQREN